MSSRRADEVKTAVDDELRTARIDLRRAIEFAARNPGQTEVTEEIILMLSAKIETLERHHALLQRRRHLH